jgi:hypothetical protein
MAGLRESASGTVAGLVIRCFAGTARLDCVQNHTPRKLSWGNKFFYNWKNL